MKQQKNINTDQPQISLEERLRSETPRFAPRLGFTERVIESLPARPHLAAKENARRTSWFRLAWPFALGGCLAVITLPLLRRPLLKPPAAGVAQIVQEAVEPVQASPLTLPEISLAKVEAFTARIDEPLEKELKYVISDTRQAIQFIASNFLPEN